MPTSFEIVEAAAMKLSPKERGDLADKLWMSVHSKEEVDVALEAEIARRIAEMDTGLTDGVPVEQVLAEMRALIESHGKA